MSTRRTKDPAGLLPDQVRVTMDGADTDFASSAAVLKSQGPASRIKALRQHPELADLADELERHLIIKGPAYKMKDGTLGPPRVTADAALDQDIRNAERRALYLAAAPHAIKSRGHLSGSSKGGKSRSAPLWHDELLKHARKLRASGRAAHELTAICAAKFSKSDDAVRRVLQRHGLVEKRKRRAK